MQQDKIKSAERSKDINRWDLPDTYKFTRNQLQSLWFRAFAFVFGSRGSLLVQWKHEGMDQLLQRWRRFKLSRFQFWVFLSRVLKLWQKWMGRIAQTDGSSEGPNHPSRRRISMTSARCSYFQNVNASCPELCWLCDEGRGSFQDGGDLLRLHQ